MYKYVAGKLAGGDTCLLGACPLGWGMLRLTRAMEAVGEFVPDLVGSAFDVADGTMTASFVASAIGDEVNPFAALRMRLMGDGADPAECTVGVLMVYHLFDPPALSPECVPGALQ